MPRTGRSLARGAAARSSPPRHRTASTLLHHPLPRPSDLPSLLQPVVASKSPDVRCTSPWLMCASSPTPTTPCTDYKRWHTATPAAATPQRGQIAGAAWDDTRKLRTKSASLLDLELPIGARVVVTRAPCPPPTSQRRNRCEGAGRRRRRPSTDPDYGAVPRLNERQIDCTVRKSD